MEHAINLTLSCVLGMNAQLPGTLASISFNNDLYLLLDESNFTEYFNLTARKDWREVHFCRNETRDWRVHKGNTNTNGLLISLKLCFQILFYLIRNASLLVIWSKNKI